MKKIKQLAMRDAFGQAMLTLAKTNKKVVALCGDLKDSLRLNDFAKQYSERYFEAGVAEQNMLGMAAGLALEGFIPFATSFAVFNPGRNWDQLRVSVCYQNCNVKIVSSHAGLNVGPDGATHQALEDIAMTRCLPNLTVIAPADFNECYQATLALAKHKGPVYMRMPRGESPVFIDKKQTFQISKADILRPGKDFTIIGTGPLLYQALEVAEQYKKKKVDIQVINLSTIKPLDTQTVLQAAKQTKHILSIEDHQVHGGLGSAIAEYLSQNYPVPMKIIGIQDTFGESGAEKELYKKYELTKKKIKQEVESMLNK